MNRHPQERGAIIPLTGLLLVVVMTSVAFAVDLGRLASERRSMQADADVIALDLVRLADGRTEAQILSSPDYLATHARSAAANGIDPADVTVDFGTYDPTTDVWDPLGDPPNAVQVLAKGTVDFFFARVFTSDDGQTQRTAIGALQAEADLSLGSKALSFASGDVSAVNFMLTTLLGGMNTTSSSPVPGVPVDLEEVADEVADAYALDADAVSYDGLATAAVQADQLAAATRAASPDGLMTASAFGLVVADLLHNDGRTVEAEIIEWIAMRSDTTAQLSVDDLLQADAGGPPAVASARLNAFDEVVSGLQLANAQNAAALCAGIPGTAIGPAASALDVCTSVVEAPKRAQGPIGADSTKPPAFRTAQVRVVTKNTKTIDQDVSLGPFSVVRVAGQINLPVGLEGGGAEGELLEILCDTASGQSTTDTEINPRPVAGFVGVQTNASGVPLLDSNGNMQGGAPIATLTIRAASLNVATVVVSLTKEIEPVDGRQAPVENQLVGTTEPGPTSALSLGLAPVEKDDFNIAVTSGALPAALTPDLLKDLLIPSVNDLLASLENPFVRDALDSLGLGISGSDLRLNGVDCGAPVLRG